MTQPISRIRFGLALWLALAGTPLAAAGQEPASPPPVPPETEEADRTRDAPDGARPKSRASRSRSEDGDAPGGADLHAQADEPYDDAQDGQEPDGAPAASDPLHAFEGAPAPDPEAVPPVHNDPLQVFTPVNAPEPQPSAEAVAAAEPAPATPATPAPAPAEPQPPAAGPAAAPAAAAETPAPERPYTPGRYRGRAGIMIGGGLTFDDLIGDVNPLGFGFGMRADYRWLPRWVFGARALYFVGGSARLTNTTVEMSTWVFAADAAYAWKLDDVYIEPGIALGLHLRSMEGLPLATATGPGVVAGTENRTQAGFYISPGVRVVLPLEIFGPEFDRFYAGADVHVDLVLGERVTGNLQFLLQAGVRY